MRSLLHQPYRRPYGARHVDILLVDLHLAGLYLRQIEDVVDELQQGGAGVPNIGHVVRLARVQGAGVPTAQHVREADNSVQRGAQLVAGVGEELRFGAARELRLVLGDGKRLLGPPAFVDLLSERCVGAGKIAGALADAFL